MKGVINTTEINKITRTYYESLCANELENLEEMDKFLDSFNLPELSQDEIDNLNSSVTSSELKE